MVRWRQWNCRWKPGIGFGGGGLHGACRFHHGSSMTRVAIVGGGPGGLMTASLLEQKVFHQCRLTLFEASARTGGKIVSSCLGGVPYEAGVAELYDYSVIGPDPLRQLVKRLGLATVK